MTNNLHSYINFLYDVTIIGSKEYLLCLQEIKQFWDSNIKELIKIHDLKNQKKQLNTISKEMRIHLEQQSSMTEENLLIFKSLNDSIVKFINANLNLKTNTYTLPKIKGDKQKAIDSINKLKNDFGLQAILINQTDNWDKVYIWSKNVRRSLNKCINDLDITKEVLNLNGKLSLQYISPLTLNEPQGITLDNKNGYFTVGLKNTEKKCFTAVFIHEMTHVYDRLGAKKYYKNNPQKASENILENKNCLSSILMSDVLNGNIELDDPFLNKFRQALLEMISIEPVEKISTNYQTRINQIIPPLVYLFISSLFGDNFEKVTNKKPVLEYITNEIQYWVLSDENISKNIDYFFNYPNRLIQKLPEFTEVDINNLMSKKEQVKEKLVSEIKNTRLNNNLCTICVSCLEPQGFFGNSKYMNTIIKHAREKNIKLNYWTVIEEVLARHIEKTTKSNFNHLGIYEVFYPKLQTTEIHKYKKLLKDLAHYQFQFKPKLKY